MRRMFPLLLFGILLGCGEEGSLSLRLLQAGFDKPFDGVQQLELRALNGSWTEVERLTATVGADNRVALGLVPSGERRLELRGLTGGATVSRGQSRPLGLESGSALDELVPFSTLKVAVAVPASRAVKPAVTVDGNLKEWQTSPSLVLADEHRITGPGLAAPADLRVELMVAWAASGQLAFALQVEDDCPSLRQGFPAGSCGSAVGAEQVYLGFDGTADGGQSYGQGDLWLAISATSVEVQRGSATQAELAVVMAPRPDLRGWVLEGTLALSALGRSGLTTADRVGLDLVVVDADPMDAQSTVFRWSTGPAPPSQPTEPARMGILGFGDPGN